MFRTLLQDVDFQQVETFCRVWPEGVRVEYKQAITQIPKIVSSFANTMGGIWLIGVKTDRKTNMPIFPLDGILAQPGIEEGISQACWTGIYPALTPAIKVIRLPSNPERVVVAVDVRESIEAPHAIENTTKVYIRNASTTEPIEFAEIDRIEYLLNRRRDPEHRREQMIEAASRRTSVSARCIRIMIGPKYPYRPLFSREELDKRLSDLRGRGMIHWSMRRIQQGLHSLAVCRRETRIGKRAA